MEPSVVDQKINLILHFPLNRMIHSCRYHGLVVGRVYIPTCDFELDLVDCFDRWDVSGCDSSRGLKCVFRSFFCARTFLVLLSVSKCPLI